MNVVKWKQAETKARIEVATAKRQAAKAQENAAKAKENSHRAKLSLKKAKQAAREAKKLAKAAHCAATDGALSYQRALKNAEKIHKKIAKAEGSAKIQKSKSPNSTKFSRSPRPASRTGAKTSSSPSGKVSALPLPTAGPEARAQASV